MSANWVIAKSVDQSAEDPSHIKWDGVSSFRGFSNVAGAYVRSSSDLLHISNATVNDVRMKTWFLIVSGFQFSSIPTTIKGVELQLSTKRYGRITDETVQMMVNGQVLGKNYANSDLADVKTYGSPTDLWGLPVLDRSMLLMPEFGFLIRFQSHPNWPHSSPIAINSVMMRVW